MRERAFSRLILASVSPRRRALLREHGYTFEVVEPPEDEPALDGNHPAPEELAERIALSKARAVARRVRAGIILGGDTIVAQNGALFGKPRDRDDARRILTALTAAPHEVITGVALVEAGTLRETTDHDRTRVYMRPMAGRELEEYLDSEAWAGKAGAYGIQDRGDAFVTRIEGSFTNVVGLPMELVARLLAGWNVQPIGQE